MKKILLLAILAMAFVGFTACSEDEKENQSMKSLKQTTWTMLANEGEDGMTVNVSFTDGQNGLMQKKSNGTTAEGFALFESTMKFTYTWNGESGKINFTKMVHRSLGHQNVKDMENMECDIAFDAASGKLTLTNLGESLTKSAYNPPLWNEEQLNAGTLNAEYLELSAELLRGKWRYVDPVLVFQVSYGLRPLEVLEGGDVIAIFDGDRATLDLSRYHSCFIRPIQENVPCEIFPEMMEIYVGDVSLWWTQCFIDPVIKRPVLEVIRVRTKPSERGGYSTTIGETLYMIKDVEEAEEAE